LSLRRARNIYATEKIFFHPAQQHSSAAFNIEVASHCRSKTEAFLLVRPGIFSTRMKNEEPGINELIQQLKDLRLQEDAVIQRILSSATNATTPPAELSDSRSNPLKIGDRVRFHSTRATRGGVGTVIGFTNGPEPFVRIHRDNSPFVIGGAEVKRKPGNVEKRF
jgi:hypothetical protein